MFVRTAPVVLVVLAVLAVAAPAQNRPQPVDVFPASSFGGARFAGRRACVAATGDLGMYRVGRRMFDKMQPVLAGYGVQVDDHLDAAVGQVRRALLAQVLAGGLEVAA